MDEGQETVVGLAVTQLVVEAALAGDTVIGFADGVIYGGSCSVDLCSSSMELGIVDPTSLPRYGDEKVAGTLEPRLEETSSGAEELYWSLVVNPGGPTAEEAVLRLE